MVHPPTPGTQRGAWAKGVVLAAVAAPGMPPLCVYARCAEHTQGPAVALHRPCTLSTREAQQAHHAAEGAAHGKQAASLTFPGSCWADRAFLVLQSYAYTSKPPIQCIECLFMLNK